MRALSRPVRSGGRLAAILLLSGFAWSSVVRAENPPTISDCRARLESEGPTRTAALCYYEVATRGADGRPAAVTLERLASDPDQAPWFTYYLGNLRWTDPGVAADLYRRAADAFSRLGDVEGEIYSRVNRTQLLSKLDQSDELVAELNRIYALSENSPDERVRAWGQITFARHLLETGEDQERAYEILHRIDLHATPDTFALQRDRLLLLGNVCLNVGRVEEARHSYRRLAELADQEGDLYVEAVAQYSLARVEFARLVDDPRSSRRSAAIKLAREALASAVAADHRTVEARSSWMLGVLSRGEKSREYFERCLRVARTPDVESYCTSAFSVWFLDRDRARARRMSDRSLELARQAGDPWTQVLAWRTAMRVHWTVDDPRQALATSMQALKAMETLRSLQPVGSEEQAGLFSIWSDDYAWVAGRLLLDSRKQRDTGWEEGKSFVVTERKRARALTDWLRRAGPESSADGQEANFATVDQVQAALAPNEALLSFLVAPWKDLVGDFGGGSWLMVITHRGVAVHRLPGRGDIRRAVRLFEGLVERRDGSEAGPAAHLYQTLLAPALSDLPPEVTRLILVPDDALHRLPFAALRPNPDGEPLGARFELVRVPSATLWMRWRTEEPARPERPVLVLADPTLSEAEQRHPEGTEEPAAAGAPVAQVRGEDDDSGTRPGETFGPLAYARKEGRAAIRDLGGGLLLAGPQATESRLATLDLASFGLLHFAAHAVTDEDRPERSAVLLAAGGTGGGGDHDGRLDSAEIARLHLGGRTVVLASCRSADGTVLRGEGVMSLARAFFQAGAHGVVASLWPLRDDESAAIFRRFYRNLAGGETVAGALHEARREAILAGEPTTAWAGLVVLGDGALVPVPGGRRIAPSAAVVAGALVAALAALGVAVAAGLRWRQRAR